MKDMKEIALELRNEFRRELILKNLELDFAHLREPIKKQDQLCAEIMHIEQKISLLERRYKLSL